MRLLWKDKRDQFRALVVQPASESLANGKEKLAVPTEPVTFAITFGYMNVAYNKRRRDVQVVFDMPNEQFWRHFSLSEAKLMRLRHEVADVFAGGTLSGAAKVCAPRFFVTGSFKSPVRVIANAETRLKWIHFLRMVEEKATFNEEFLWFGPLPGVIGCVDGNFVTSRSEQKALFWCHEGYFALGVMLICVADMAILALDPQRPGLDEDSHICVGPRI
ncbi:hypothetical protein HPB51_020887 [Rhipicephalus microplus]|uniref:Uncharacterized protein n=1 Tax=Rhipicephalus microplus TaxID=6941 RepID=A0A9J6EUS0_RHIMP|nr:hypothetical protein HPB51_020887 [Rhipicephalus microplus]